RPQSVAREPSREHLQGDVATQTAGTPDVLGREPIAALLDGMPIQNHTRLRGRLIVDDPDDLDAEYPVVRRAHGTAMASLIIHGDLNQPGEPIGRPLVVHPVMRPAPNGDEATPSDRLLVDVIYRAVRRIKEGDGDLPASAPDVVLINISLGDKWRPFAGVMSPLGRLLDYLAARYGILFIISAGNILDRITVPAYTTRTAFEDAPPDQRENAILDALFANRSQRSLYSPAEALNALTVGAAHSAVGYTGRLSSD